jgi:hypothetical protein
MRNHRPIIVLALLLGAQFVLSGCITIPTMADRVVELVTTTSVADTLHASGSTNYILNDSGIFDVNSLGIAGILDDAGIDVSDVTGISLASVSYQVVTADVVASRNIAGTVKVSCAGGPIVDLVNPFNANAGAVTAPIPASLSAAGVTQINNLLAALLTAVKSGTGTVPNGNIIYTVNGTSTPSNQATDFYYVLKLTLNVQGTVKTKMLTGS